MNLGSVSKYLCITCTYYFYTLTKFWSKCYHSSNVVASVVSQQSCWTFGRSEWQLLFGSFVGLTLFVTLWTMCHMHCCSELKVEFGHVILFPKSVNSSTCTYIFDSITRILLVLIKWDNPYP